MAYTRGLLSSFSSSMSGSFDYRSKLLSKNVKSTAEIFAFDNKGVLQSKPRDSQYSQLTDNSLNTFEIHYAEDMEGL